MTEQIRMTKNSFLWSWRATTTVFVLASAVLLWRAPGIESYYWNPDHGYQLSMGAAVLHGGFPFVDFVSIYGPLVALVTAAALSPGHLFGETLVCVIAYAACSALLFNMLRDRVGVVVAIIIAGSAFWFVARFHKWYIWFFPLVLVYCYHRYLASARTQLYWWNIAGVMAGIGGLFRIEFGMAFAGVWMLLAFLEWLIDKKTLKLCLFCYLRFAISFAVVLAIWLTVLASQGGFEAIQIYFLSAATGVQGVVGDWALSTQFHRLAPFSVESTIHALVYWVLPSAYATCIAYGLFRSRSVATDKSGYALFCVAVGLVGFAMYPHGWYRPDIAHLRQTLVCGLVAIPCVGRIAWELDPVLKNSARWAIRITSVLYIAISCAWGTALLRIDSWDWAPLLSDAMPRLTSLLSMESSRPYISERELALAIRELSAPGESILVAPFMPQLFYWSNRNFSGISSVYLEGIYDGRLWREKNLAQVRRDPPALVVIDVEDLDQSTSRLYRSHPGLYEYIRNRYTKVVYQIRNRYVLEQTTR